MNQKVTLTEFTVNEREVKGRNRNLIYIIRAGDVADAASNVMVQKQ